MATSILSRLASVLALATITSFASALTDPVGTGFTYQGQLTFQGDPFTGTANLVFRLHDSEVGGTPLATLNANNFAIGEDGRFTIDLDFGDHFDGSPRWLAIQVNGQALSPRQPLMPTPHAMVATTAANVPTKAVVGVYTGITGVGTLDSLNVSGNVGIGTTSPNRPLHVVSGSVGMTSNSNSTGVFERAADNYISILTPTQNARGILFGDPSHSAHGALIYNPSNVLNGLVFRTNGNNSRMVINDSGNVGIGTVDPQHRLHITGPNNISMVYAANNWITIRGIHTAAGTFPGVQGETNSESNGATGIRGFVNSTSPGSNSSGVWGRNFGTNNNGQGIRGTHDGGGTGVVGESATGTGVRGVSSGAGGYGGVFGDLSSPGRGILVVAQAHLADRVGIGSTNPNSMLHVNGASGTNPMRVQSAGATKLLVHNNGNVMIGSASAPQDTLHVAGTTRTNVLRIMGGSDLAERFDIAEVADLTPQPGMVVCIDPVNPGKLILSSRAYDRTVAGIISGANGINSGMVMGQEGSEADGAHPVALTGRVYVFADATKGAIEPGDLLTTSDTPGHAMRATDRDRRDGAVIGKAMTGLAAGETGMVLVLVSLQ